MTRPGLLEALSERTLVCDGAMGTQLMAAGLPSGTSADLWNITHPDAVRQIQRRYRASGCDLLTTNTFGGTFSALERHGLAERMAEINRRGAELARDAAGEEGYVLGDMGPFGGFLEPMGDTTPEQLSEVFFAQAQALASGGADGFIIETMSDPGEMEVAIVAARKAAPKLPIIATYAFQLTDGAFRTMMGTPVAEAIARAASAGADVVGSNCGTGLGLPDYVRLAGEIRLAAKAASAARGRTIGTILQPNAGSPVSVGGQLRYAATPEDMAAVVPQFTAGGLSVLGGCCGTTPAHLAAMSKAL